MIDAGEVVGRNIPSSANRLDDIQELGSNLIVQASELLRQ